jgi:hypothetical protein
MKLRHEINEGFSRGDFPTVAFVWPGVVAGTLLAESSEQVFETVDGYRPSDYPVRPLLFGGSARLLTPSLGHFTFQSEPIGRDALPVNQLKPWPKVQTMGNWCEPESILQSKSLCDW